MCPFARCQTVIFSRNCGSCMVGLVWVLFLTRNTLKTFCRPDTDRELTKFEWPGGFRMAVCLSWDVDGEAAIYSRFPDRAKRLLSELAQRAYGPRVGIWKVLSLLEEYDLPATFFIPSYTAQLHPDVVEAIVKRGHPIGLHGYLHEYMESFELESEEQVLVRSKSTLTKMLGYAPTLYRAPSWELNRWTPALLVKHGVLSDSSLMEDEVPYGVWTPLGPLIEIPVHWILDDAEHWHHSRANRDKEIKDPDAVFRLWSTEFDGYYKSGGCFVLTMHPFISGRWTHMQVIENLIRYIKGFPGVWWATLEDVTKHSLSLLGEGKLNVRDLPSSEVIKFDG